MGERGPRGQHDYDEVAFICRRANANGQSMSLAVSAELDIAEKAARAVIVRARRAGYSIPLVRADLVTDDPEYLPLGVYDEVFSREDWMQYGECVGIDPDLFFPARGEDVTAAKRVCAGCMVKDACLDYALRRGEKHGVWGGYSERERRTMRRSIRVQARAFA